MLDRETEDTQEKRLKDAALINKMAAAHFNFCNDRSALLLAKLSLFLAPADINALSLLANVEFRFRRYSECLEAILDIESVTNGVLSNDLRLKKALCLGKLGQTEAGRATISR